MEGRPLKIDNVSHLSPPNAVTQSKNSDKTGAARETSTAGGAPSTTQLNPATTDGSRDIDHARVDEIRQAIAEGRLDIHAERIAEGLIASVRDWLEQAPQ